MCDVSGQFSDTGHDRGNSHYSQRLSVVLTVSIQPADGVQTSGLFCAISLIHL